MNWKGHMVLGAATFCGIYALFVVLDSRFNLMLYMNTLIPLPTLFIAIPIGLYSSVVPDTDIRTSMAYSASVVLIVLFTWILVILVCISPLLGLIALSLCMVGLLIPHHRGFMHTLTFAMLFGMGIGILFADWRISICSIGCALSHLLGDK